MQSSRSSSSLPHVDITHIMQTSRAAARRHQVAAAHSSALQRERWRAGTERDRERQAGAHQGEEREKERTQVIKKECGYACDSDCDNNLDLDAETFINIDMHPIGSVHESALCVRNMIGHSSSHGYGRVQTTELPSMWRKPTATAFIHQKHWEDISPSQSLQVLEISPEGKLCKSPHVNEAYTSLCFGQPQERTQTGENLNENDLTRDTYGQNGEVIHTEVKQFVGQLCEEAFSNSSEFVNHENSHIGKKRDNGSQSGKIFRIINYLSQERSLTHVSTVGRTSV
ncbi:hypothetical protein STEG23_025679 [Scotinomys teguina]